MCSAVVSAVVLLLVLVHVQDSVAPGMRTKCLTEHPPHPCRDGWVQLKDSKCVKYFRLPKTFWQAQKHCSDRGGHLASIQDPDENQRVLCVTVLNHKSSPTNNDYFWIGGRSSAPLSGYGWTDSSLFDFTKWHSGQPMNKAGHTCVVMNYNKWGEWANIDCNKKENFVCVREM